MRLCIVLCRCPAAAKQSDSDAFRVHEQHHKDIDAVVEVPDGSRTSSIYDLNTTRRRYLILFVTAVAAILLPFTDTIYLPALQVRG